jgi:hypothetical protein
MKRKICSIFLLLYTGLLLAQLPEMIIEGNNDLWFVQSCDSNSLVSNLTKSMGDSKLKLPLPVITKDVTFYRLKSKTKPVTFSFNKEGNNKINVWLNDKEKHCFIIDSSRHYSFQGYSLSNDELEVYGTISWDKWHRKFRIIFNNKRKYVYFDFDGL